MAQLSYPGLSEIKDSVVARAVRLLWDTLYKVEVLAKGPTEGTLSPDTKPRLGSGDVGSLFFATDFNRLYRWTGSTWTDDSTAPPRFQISFFASSPEPVTGWVPCDGRSTIRSTSSGGTAYFTVPVTPSLEGNSAWLRV